ncbi:MAG: hypothetical protein AB7Q29_11600 [Vicinamibacterales bacterium]
MARRLATRQEAVQALGLRSVRALERLLEKGAPGPRPGKPGSRRYDVAAIAAWREQRAAQTRPTVDLSAARARLAVTQERLAALKVRELRGLLIRRLEAAAALTAIIAAARASLLAVPRRAVLAGLPREHEPLVRQLVTDALRELSETRTLDALSTRAEAADV